MDIKNDIRKIKSPLLLNDLRFEMTIDDLRKLGYAVLILPNATIMPAAMAAYQFLLELRQEGSYPRQIKLEAPSFYEFDQWISESLELNKLRKYEAEFLPKKEIVARYGTQSVPETF